MKINTRWFWVLNIPMLLGIGFLSHELYAAEKSEFSIFGEKNIGLIKNKQQILSFQTQKSDNSSALIAAIQPYFLEMEIIPIESLATGHKYQSDLFTVDRLTPNVTRVNSQGKTLFLFDTSVSEIEWGQIKGMPISLDSDFWILKQNEFPDFFQLQATSFYHRGFLEYWLLMFLIQ